MNFTFLHCADLHLGSPMTGLSLKDDIIAERFSAASRGAFSELVTLAIAERVAFVLIAGDLYDGEWRDNSIGLFFNREAARLTRVNIPIFLIKGNHDAASVVTKTLQLGSMISEFQTRKAHTLELAELKVAIHGRSFPDRAVTDNWALDYPRAKDGWFNIGMLHTSCAGNARHETYAPCSIEDMATRGYDYWALGHVHAHEILLRDPWIVYPGNLQGRSIRETGAKGAVFVDVEDGKVKDVRRVIVDRARWIEAVVDVNDATTLPGLYAMVETSLAGALRDASGRLVAARVRLVGSTGLNNGLRADRRQLHDDIQAIADRIDEDVWIEKVAVGTRSLAVATRVADLSSVDLEAMLVECVDDPRFQARVNEAIADVISRYPNAGINEPPLADDLRDLIEESLAVVLSRANVGAPR